MRIVWNIIGIFDNESKYDNCVMTGKTTRKLPQARRDGTRRRHSRALCEIQADVSFEMVTPKIFFLSSRPFNNFHLPLWPPTLPPCNVGQNCCLSLCSLHGQLFMPFLFVCFLSIILLSFLYFITIFFRKSECLGRL